MLLAWQGKLGAVFVGNATGRYRCSDGRCVVTSIKFILIVVLSKKNLNSLRNPSFGAEVVKDDEWHAFFFNRKTYKKRLFFSQIFPPPAFLVWDFGPEAFPVNEHCDTDSRVRFVGYFL